MIDLKNISLSYDSKKVLHNISLKINEGELIAVIGPNGAGKTTLLRVIAGALKPKGTVLLLGRKVHRIPGAERAALLAMVPQNIDPDIPLSGYDFVMLGRTHCLPRFGVPAHDDIEAVLEAMRRTGTLELKTRFFKEMSGGERQRLALAMAFAARPRVILLDEATAHLDLHHRAAIMSLLREMNRVKGVTVIMAAHDLTLAGRYFNRLILLKEGHLLQDGPPRSVLNAQILEEAYGCAVRVIELPDNLGSAIAPLENSEII